MQSMDGCRDIAVHFGFTNDHRICLCDTITNVQWYMQSSGGQSFNVALPEMVGDLSLVWSEFKTAAHHAVECLIHVLVERFKAALLGGLTTLKSFS